MMLALRWLRFMWTQASPSCTGFALLARESTLDQPMSFRALVYQVMDHMRNTFLQVRYRCNSQPPLFALPPPVMHQILSFVPAEDIRATPGICRGFRASCLAVQSLWSTILLYRDR